jgi:hypothetical protein
LLGPKNSRDFKEDLIVGTFALPADRPFLVDRDFAFGITVAANDFTTSVTSIKSDPGDPLGTDFTFRIIHP